MHTIKNEDHVSVVLKPGDGGNLVVQTGGKDRKRYLKGDANSAPQYAEPSCRLHDELVCWLFENAPNHVIKNDMDGVRVDFYDSEEVAEEFIRAAVCLRVMGPTVLGNTWEVLQELTRKVKDQQT